MKKLLAYLFCCFSLFIFGCTGTTGNDGQLQSFPIAGLEADWIRNGEPIVFEDETWYPSDGIEVLMDSEVLLKGEHRSVQFFVEKTDIRPYDRLYTKFSRNQFRFFEKMDK